jgi:hypothetical protein
MLIGEGEKCFPAKISISLQKKQWTLVKHNLLMGTQSMYTKRDIPLPLPGSAAEGLQML